MALEPLPWWIGQPEGKGCRGAVRCRLPGGPVTSETAPNLQQCLLITKLGFKFGVWSLVLSV